MSETKWTPGPWEITSGFIGPLKIVASVDKSIDRSGKMEVAHVGAETFDQCRANARLISAAPDMAGALKELMSEIDRHGKLGDRGHDDDDVWLGDASGVVRAGAVRRARSALAKARGET